MIIQVRGLNELEAQLKIIPERVLKEASTTVNTVCLDLKGKSQMITPVLTGDLQGSAFKEVRVSAGSIQGSVGFATPYAHRQHEHPEYQHNAPGQAKYLEQPFNENIEVYRDLIRDAIRRGLKQ